MQIRDLNNRNDLVLTVDATDIDAARNDWPELFALNCNCDAFYTKRDDSGFTEIYGFRKTEGTEPLPDRSLHVHLIKGSAALSSDRYTYKWNNAQQWLQQYLNGLSYAELQQEARNLASNLDDDKIEEIYSSDMNAQGYFTSIDSCEFEHPQPHEWHCVTHDVTKIAGLTQPVHCDWESTITDDEHREQSPLDYAAQQSRKAGWNGKTTERESDDGLEMSDDNCGECGHPYKRGDETHYPECSRIEVNR